MKTLQNFWDQFNTAYYNHPINFVVERTMETGEDDAKTFYLEHMPIASHDPYLPVVKVNDVEKTENVDYTIDYEQGIITFDTALSVGDNFEVDGYYQKCNLRQFVTHYNRTVRKMTVAYLPYRKFEEVAYTDVVGATEDEYISEIDLDTAPYSSWREVDEIYQEADDSRPVEFIKRENKIYFVVQSMSPYPEALYPNDYSFSQQPYSLARPNVKIKYPFYIAGVKKYTELQNTDATVLDQEIEFTDEAYEQALLLTALHMYLALNHQLEVIGAATLKNDTGRSIYLSIQSLNQQLMNNLRIESPIARYNPYNHKKFNNEL